MEKTGNLKKIIRVTKDGESVVAGLANSIYEYLLAVEEAEIVPMCGNKDYITIDNVYCSEIDDIVSYKIEE